MYHSISGASPYHVLLAPCDGSEPGTAAAGADADSVWGILFASGPEAVGLVTTAAGWLADRGANIEASYASRLINTHAGQYRFRTNRCGWDAVMFDWPQAAVALARCRLHAGGVRPDELVLRHELDLIAGQDRPGILAEVTRIFADLRINIVTHASRRFSVNGPMAVPRGQGTGRCAELFTVNMKVDIPRRYVSRALPEIMSQLAALEASRGWDISFGERNRAAGDRPRARSNLTALLN
jgi:glycine cleavage system regulatory protein